MVFIACSFREERNATRRVRSSDASVLPKAGVLTPPQGSVGALLHDGLKKHLGETLPGIPLLGFCTFGEQGHVPGFGNVHQDLALSLLVLGEQPVLPRSTCIANRRE